MYIQDNVSMMESVMSCGVLPESLRASVNTAACTVITPPSVATPLMSRGREGGRKEE